MYCECDVEMLLKCIKHVVWTKYRKCQGNITWQDVGNVREIMPYT